MAGEAGFQLLVDITKKVIEPVVDVVVLHFGYLIHYKSNIKNLKQRVEELQSTKADAENFFNSCGYNNEETTHTNTLWLNRIKAAANAVKEATEKPKTGCLSKWCPNPVKRYQLSRDAVKEAEEIRQLQNQGSAYVSTTNRALPPSKLIGALANRGSNDFKSRAKIMDELMKALKDDKISIIGVCGTGGVGKTTLMHELREMAKLNDLFHEVAVGNFVLGQLE